MIKIYLLVLIIIFLIFLCIRKENFQQEEQENCPAEKESTVFGSILLNGYGVYKDQKTEIVLNWNHPSGLVSDKDNIKQYVIIRNVNNDFDFINEITDDIELKDSNYSYTISNNIESNIMYSITINIFDTKTSTMISSNSLKIKPQPEVMNDEEIIKQVNSNSIPEQLLNTLKNKTFDIYL